jgi:hydroxymethylglutaryl-CoA lyase
LTDTTPEITPRQHLDTAILSDVSLREHGQNVSKQGLKRFSVARRIAVAKALIKAGFRRLEVISCVSPHIAPAMEETQIATIANAVGRHSNVMLVTLVPNRRGLKTFLRLGLGPEGLNHTIGLFFSAIEAHNQANLGRSIEASKKECATIASTAKRNGIPFVGYVSAAFGYRDPAGGPPQKVGLDALVAHIEFYRQIGARTVTLSDLQGVASPKQTKQTLTALFSLLSSRCPDIHGVLGYHPHHRDPRTGMLLVKAAVESGIRLVDASLCAAGGCVTGAPGNVDTISVFDLLEQNDIDTGIRPTKLSQAEALFSNFVSNPISQD